MPDGIHQVSPRHTVIAFSYLQILDLLTTVAFLMAGLQEGNHLIRALLGIVPNAVSGLLAVKIVAIGLGIYCACTRRHRLLARATAFYAFLVGWNLIALIVGLGR
jgi:hypothetical protein